MLGQVFYLIEKYVSELAYFGGPYIECVIEGEICGCRDGRNGPTGVSHSPGLNRAEAQLQCSYIGYNPNLTR